VVVRRRLTRVARTMGPKRSNSALNSPSRIPAGRFARHAAACLLPDFPPPPGPQLTTHGGGDEIAKAAVAETVQTREWWKVECFGVKATAPTQN